MDDIRDRIRGTLLGLAAGDRNGGPVRMAVRLAEGLVERRRFDPDDILARYLDWWRHGAFDTGPVVAAVLARIDAGEPPDRAAAGVHEATGGRTAGCNPAHRSPPLAMAAALADDELDGHARREAGLTHRHPLAGEAAAAGVVLCRALIRGRPWQEAIDRARGGRPGEIAEALDLASSRPVVPGGFAPDVLRAAARFVARSDSFEAALGRSLAFAGPANYAPVLVGAIAGARWGASSISERELGHCEILPRADEAAMRLSKDWG